MTKTAAPAPDIATMTFEQALKELEAIVKRLESGDATLEQSITDYERGTALKNLCQKRLDDAKMKVDQITQGENNTLRMEPFGNA